MEIMVTPLNSGERTTGGLASVGRDEQTISFYHNSTFDPAAELI
jgi:hypothetical protein